MEKHSRVCAHIDLDAVLHNAKAIHDNIAKDAKIMAVIKTDGYGHGAVPIGKELEALEFVWGYAVATAEEGITRSRNGLNKPILSLGATFPEQYPLMAEYDLRPTVFSLSTAEQMSRKVCFDKTSASIFVEVENIAPTPR